MSGGREARLREAGRQQTWDVVVIGGGSAGLGCAVEAASRGLRTLLLERGDFAQGTSSRSTKLVHGGVRYLQQFNFTLVLDALRERGHMLHNAPHLVHPLNFIVPITSYGGIPYYGVGLKAYELLSGKLSFGKSEWLSVAETRHRLPTLHAPDLKGGILYRDGQFDDARYCIALLRTFEDLGGTALNYCDVTRLLKSQNKITGVGAHDRETTTDFDITARAVINATGVFSQTILQMDEGPAEISLAISQGTHFVLPKDFLPVADALMIPKTDDGRVLFAIPWHERLLVGTTDEAVPESSSEPRATHQETAFLAEHIHRYLGRAIAATDVLSMWSGLRPLIKSSSASTSRLSRDHRVLISPTGLVTVVGGKWTTYRKMGEDTVSRAAESLGLKAAPSRTANLKLHGWRDQPAPTASESDQVYGSDFEAVTALANDAPDLNDLLHPALPYRKRDILWAARHEHARTVADVLARRTRALFLDARAAAACAPEVSHLLAAELGRSEASRIRDLETFQALAQRYIFTA